MPLVLTPEEWQAVYGTLCAEVYRSRASGEDDPYLCPLLAVIGRMNDEMNRAAVALEATQPEAWRE